MGFHIDCILIESNISYSGEILLLSRSKSNRNSSLCVRGEQWKYFAHLWAVMKRSEKGGEEISPSKDLRAGQNAVWEKTRK